MACIVLCSFSSVILPLLSCNLRFASNGLIRIFDKSSAPHNEIPSVGGTLKPYPSARTSPCRECWRRYFQPKMLRRIVVIVLDSARYTKGTTILCVVPLVPFQISPPCSMNMVSSPPNSCQELLHTRLAMGIVEREDDDVTMEKLDKALGELFEKKVRDCLHTVLVDLPSIYQSSPQYLPGDSRTYHEVDISDRQLCLNP